MIHTTQTWKIGDCLKLMREMVADSVDLIVTDPPYFMVNKSGSGFMGKEWDSVSVKATTELTKTQVMYRQIREFHTDWMTDAIRVLKPGAFAFIMSSPRQDVLSQMIVAAGESGFNTMFSSVYWTFASGFPKAGNVSKMVDKRLGAEREVIGIKHNPYTQTGSMENDYGEYNKQTDDNGYRITEVTAPATTQDNELDGAYTPSLKPAVEVVLCVMKPLSHKSYTEQAMDNGKGIFWMDDCRIPYQSDRDKYIDRPQATQENSVSFKLVCGLKTSSCAAGRFPANLLVSDDVLNDGVFRHKAGNVRVSDMGDYNASSYKASDYPHNPNYYSDDIGDSFSRYFDLDAWFDTKYLPKEAQKTFPFMIVPKASKSEKGANNKHPTAKPVKLFSWLMTLGSREGDLVLDPFLGSGVALAAGRLTNRSVIGYEIDPQWEHLYADRCMAHTSPLTRYFSVGDEPKAH